MAAMPGVVLQTSIQTHEFVAQWQNQSHMLWTIQSKINEEIESKIGDLQQAVPWLGNQIVSLQHQLFLSCDWNVTVYCATPEKYNAS
jgi:cell division protein FtsX